MKRLFLIGLALFLTACSEKNADNKTSASANTINTNLGNTSKIPLCIITDNSIGGIQIGNTLNKVKQSFPHATITPTNDSENIKFVSIKLNPDVEIFAYTSDNTTSTPITYLYTNSKSCQTQAGVHPDMPLTDVEQFYGKVEQIIMSEDAQQTAEFAQQPPTLSFGIDDSGNFDPNDHDLPKIASSYQANTRITDIAVIGLPTY